MVRIMKVVCEYLKCWTYSLGKDVSHLLCCCHWIIPRESMIKWIKFKARRSNLCSVLSSWVALGKTSFGSLSLTSLTFIMKIDLTGM